MHKEDQDLPKMRLPIEGDWLVGPLWVATRRSDLPCSGSALLLKADLSAAGRPVRYGQQQTFEMKEAGWRLLSTAQLIGTNASEALAGVLRFHMLVLSRCNALTCLLLNYRWAMRCGKLITV